MNPTLPTENSSPAGQACPFTHRAMMIWPRLDRQALARCGCDSERIVAFVAQRTSLPVDVVTELLEERGPAESNWSLYFG